jgi:hypothetical protein
MSELIYGDSEFVVRMKLEILFAWMFLLFIFSWISVEVVGRALNNFTFNTLGLNEKSTYHTVIIAAVVVILELVTLSYFRSIGALDPIPMPQLVPVSDDSDSKDDEDTSARGNGSMIGGLYVKPSPIELITTMSEIAII